MLSSVLPMVFMVWFFVQLLGWHHGLNVTGLVLSWVGLGHYGSEAVAGFASIFVCLLLLKLFEWLRGIGDENDGVDRHLSTSRGFIMLCVVEIMFFFGVFWFVYSIELCAEVHHLGYATSKSANSGLEHLTVSVISPKVGIDLSHLAEYHLDIVLTSESAVPSAEGVGTVVNLSEIHSSRKWLVPSMSDTLYASCVLVASGVVTNIVGSSAVNTAKSTYWYALAIVLGIIFVGCQYSEYAYEVPYGLTSDRIGHAFYGVTGLHGSHVLVGLLMLVIGFLYTIVSNVDSAYLPANRYVISYWHLVDSVWFVVLAALYGTLWLL